MGLLNADVFCFLVNLHKINHISDQVDKMLFMNIWVIPAEKRHSSNMQGPSVAINCLSWNDSCGLGEPFSGPHFQGWL